MVSCEPDGEADGRDWAGRSFGVRVNSIKRTRELLSSGQIKKQGPP